MTKFWTWQEIFRGVMLRPQLQVTPAQIAVLRAAAKKKEKAIG